MRARRRLSVNYQELAKLTAADAAAYDNFGRSVAIDGDTVVVGAKYDNDGGFDSGSVYTCVATLQGHSKSVRRAASALCTTFVICLRCRSIVRPRNPQLRPRPRS